LKGEINAVGASNGRSGTLSALLGNGIPKLRGLAWRVQGTVKQSGNLNTADYYLNNTGVQEINYSAALGYTGKRIDADAFFSHFNTSIGIFQGSNIGSMQDLTAHIAHGRPFDDGNFAYAVDAPRQQVYHDLLKLKAHVHLTSHLLLNVVYGFQHDRRQEFDMRRGGRTDMPDLNLSLLTHTLGAFLDYYNDKGVKLTMGANGQTQANANTPGTFVTPLIPNYSVNGGGAYAIARYIKPHYELEAGVRYDYRRLDALGYNSVQQLYGGVQDYQNISGSGGVVWYIRRNMELRSNLGSAWRPPEVSELYSDGLHHGAAAIELGDSTMKPEQSFKWMNTLTYHTPNNQFHASLNAYVHYIYQYIYLSPSDSFQESLRGAFPVFNYHQTDARFLGADLWADYRFLPRFTYAVNFSMIRAKDIRNNLFLPTIPADRLEHSLQWNLPNSVHFKNSYLQLAHVYVAHQNRYEFGSDFAASPAAYHLLNLNMGTEWQWRKNKLGINLAVHNLTNTLYKDYMNRFRYYAHDLGRNMILRLTYRF
jgi:iron complex outermembrane receptor protein